MRDRKRKKQTIGVVVLEGSGLVDIVDSSVSRVVKSLPLEAIQKVLPDESITKLKSIRLGHRRGDDSRE